MAFPVLPSIYADFANNNYIFNGAQFRGSGPWLTAAGGSFSRGSTATFVNSAGVLTQAANNVLRLDFDLATLAAKGALFEGSSTNLALQSQTLSNAVWSNNGSATTDSANTTVAPDGTTTADTLTFSASANDEWTQVNVSYSNGVTYTVSGYAKVASGTKNFRFIWNDEITNARIGSFTATTSWQRFSASFTAGKDTAIGHIGWANDAAGTSGNLIAWGIQVEALPFASSYIPTVGTTVTRSADLLTIPTPSLSALTQYANFTTANTASSAVVQGIFSVNDGTTSNRSDLRFGQQEAIVSSGGGNVLISIPALSAAGNYLFAAALQSGDYAESLNAAAVTTATPTFPLGLTTFQIGGIDAVTTENLFGWISSVGLWSSRLTNAQLVILSTASPTFDLFPTNLTNKAGRYFSRRDYAEWLKRVAGEREAEEEEYQSFIRAAEYERSLTPIQRANRDYDDAEAELSKSEEALFNSLNETNHIKFSEAREKRDQARKDRDHHYFMDVVKKEWDKHNESKRR